MSLESYKQDSPTFSHYKFSNLEDGLEAVFILQD